MTRHDTGERDSAHGDGQGPTTIWGYSLAAAAACLGTGGLIALIGLFG